VRAPQVLREQAGIACRGMADQHLRHAEPVAKEVLSTQCHVRGQMLHLRTQDTLLSHR